MKKHNLLDSFGFAFSGLRQTLHGRNIKIHLMAATLVILAGIFFQITAFEWLALVIMIGLVISAEVFNSAIEQACNVYDEKLKMEYGESHLPRDMAAGAVLVLAIASVFVGLIIFLPYLSKYL